MKKRCFQILALLLTLVLLLPDGVHADGDGTAHIVSDPAGADIWLDGELYVPAVTPCDIPLSGGAHTLSVRVKGYDPYETAVRPGDSVAAKLLPTIPEGEGVRTIVVDSDDHGRADGRLMKWELYERFVLNGEPAPEWNESWTEEDELELYACQQLTDGISLREAICIALNDNGWYDPERGIRRHYVIEFSGDKDEYMQTGDITCYGRGAAKYVNGEELFIRYTEEGPKEDAAGKALWSDDGCFTINGDRDRDGTPDVTLTGWDSGGWDGRWTLDLMCSDAHVIGLNFAPTMHVCCGIPFWQPLNYFNVHDIYITGCAFEGIKNGVGRFFGVNMGAIYGHTAAGPRMPGTYDLDGYYVTGCTFRDDQLGFIFAGGDLDYACAKNLVLQANRLTNGMIFVRNVDAHTWYMWPGNGEMSGTAYGEDCIGFSEHNTLENVTISGNSVEFTADVIESNLYDGGYGCAIKLGNSNLGGSHNTMRGVRVRCNRTTLEQANVDAYQHWPNAGVSISNACVGDGMNDGYDGDLASSLCEVSDNLFEDLTVEYNDFKINFFSVNNVDLAGTAQVGTGNVFRNIRIEDNRIQTVKGLRFFGASGTSNPGCAAEGAMENVTVRGNGISCLRKTGWGAESELNDSGEQEDFGVELIGADIADYDGSNWDESGERAVWDKLRSQVSGACIEDNTVTGFANGVLVAGAYCERTHYVTGITVEDVTIQNNEIATDGVNKNCRNHGIVLVGAIDGGTGCVVHRVSVSGNKVRATNGLLAAGFYFMGMRCRFGIRDDKVLHVTARDNSFTFTDPQGNGGFPIVTSDAVSGWGEIPFALGEATVVLTQSGNTATGFAWKSMELSELSMRKETDGSALVAAAQSCSDAAASRGYIQWAKDTAAETCETPLFAGVCETPNYRPGNCHRWYLAPCEAGVRRDGGTAPTCTEPGGYGQTLHCTLCGEELRRVSGDTIPALGHDWVETSCVWRSDMQSVAAEAVCRRCRETLTETVQTTSEVTLAPTVDAEGVRTYTAVFRNECFGTRTNWEPIPKLEPGDPCANGHDWDEPTYTWAEDDRSITAARRCKNDPEHSESETVQTTAEITKPATYEKEGELVYTAAFTNKAFATQTKTVAVAKLEKPALPCDGADGCPGKRFTDMPAKENWAHDAIDWAIVSGVTSGTSSDRFSPGRGCTRAQVVTFLWRAAGEPEPASAGNPFEDVKEGAYYYAAVLWAVENKVTSGTGANRFSPDATCTRAQIVTFLWRFGHEPAPQNENNPFRDVKEGAYYCRAVLWASGAGVTAGTAADRFSPNAVCTRGQVVTFLYRDIGA